MNSLDSMATRPAVPEGPVRPVTLVPAVIFGLALIAVRAFEWSLIELLTPFLAPLVALPVLLLFAGATLAALIEGVVGLWKRQFRRLLPLGVCVASLAAAVFVPWTRLMLDVDFRLHQREREVVALRVLQGEFSPNSKLKSGVLPLPPKYRRLSAGGEVQVEPNAVLFFTFRGVLDNFSGFVYSPDDFEPGFGAFGGDFKEVRRVRKNWFWVSSS